jgi:hypothetical protein
VEKRVGVIKVSTLTRANNFGGWVLVAKKLGISRNMNGPMKEFISLWSHSILATRSTELRHNKEKKKEKVEKAKMEKRKHKIPLVPIFLFF